VYTPCALKKAATEEQTSGTKVRGQATLGMFEDVDQ